MARIALLEDETGLREELAVFLTHRGHTISQAGCLAEFWPLMATIDLAILDIMLPDGSGTEAAIRLHWEHPRVGVILLTARAGAEDKLAGLYGGRPGVMGALRLGRLVITHIIATGGLAMTDDLLGQFLGQDALRRLSRRLGEGAFNGALTARLGVAAIEVTRPAPFLDTEPVRVREIFSELMRSLRSGRGASAPSEDGTPLR